MRTGTVVIIGGGIGGLTAAIALRRRGVDAQVYEAAPQLEAVGAGIMVPANAMQVLDRLEVGEDVRARGMAIHRGDLCDARAGLLQRMDQAHAERRYGSGITGIHRARLQEVLASRIPAHALHLGRRFASLRQDESGVTVSFQDGAQVRAGLVVGADGVHSGVRSHVRPEAELRYSGQTSYRAVVALDLGGQPANTAVEVWGAGFRFGYAPVAPGEVYWYATRDAAPGVRDAPGQAKEELRSLAAGFPAPIPALVEAAEPHQLIRTDMFDLPGLRGWHRGRVVLLGDAAHATTPNLGQGGAQAIEDAWVLAEQLAATDDVPAALRAYESMRAGKAHRVINTSWRIGRLAHVRNPLGRALRNWLVRCAPARTSRRQLDWMYALDY
ncbi:MAG TPA: FAD-dependent monooxygenase [Longimicrobium sp.]|jgi:2-polyprenyl-6-methoxyphenol hydroxylase-like FAD-dependent oxidoreductase|uniref:FAD-dependent monooxygenase n=1 Tax=Longimicrobium sp. TaxID=2029185 RepID=UPI002ED873B8